MFYRRDLAKLRITIIILLVTSSYYLNAQISHNMLASGNESLTICDAWIYDNGGQNANYSNSSDATLTLTSSSGGIFQIASMNYNMESCCDYLKIYAGTGTSGTLLATYRGTGTMTTPLLLAAGTVTLQFHSDGSVNYSGFALHIECVSSNSMSTTPLTTCSMVWSDPGGINNYANNLDVTQTICSATTDHLLVQFSIFALSTGDFLSVYDGNSTSAPLIGTYTGTNIPGQVISTGTCLTFRFVSNGSGTNVGWMANISCQTCVPASTTSGSPCAINGANPFCTDQNPYGITYASGTAGSASSFFNSSMVGCLYSVPRPAWYYMRINNPGNLLIYIQQQNLQGIGIDVDFACWGPFTASSETDFLDNLCCGYYQLNTAQTSSHRPPNGNHTNDMGGYPSGNLVDCSYFADPAEWCYIPNAQNGQYYILLITNYSGSAGTITFNAVSTSSTASTDCSLLASGMSNSPVCVGDTIRLYCQNPQAGATYSWVGPNNWTSTSEDPIIVDATTAMTGTYSLVKHYNGQNSDTVHIPVVVNLNPVVTVFSDKDTVCSNQTATITAGGGDTYHWSNGMNGATITVTPQTNTTYHVTVTTAANCIGSDSISLIAAPVRTTTLSDTICAGEPYNRYGFSLSAENTQNGPDSTLHATYATAFGCDSTVNLHLRFFPRPHTEFSIIRCDSYTWNDSIYTTSGHYVKHFQTTQGCDSMVTLHLTINHSITSELSITDCDSYTWNDSNYTVSGNYVKHFQTTLGCDSVVTLHLSINQSAASEFTITECDSYTWNDSVYSSSGNYAQRFLTVHGCDSTVTLHLSINDIITNNINAVACDSYTWDDSIYTQSGVYTRHYQSVHLCDSTVILHLTVNYSYAATYYDTICKGDVYSLHGFYIPSDSTLVLHNMVVTRHAGAFSDCDSTMTLFLTIDQMYPSIIEQLPEHCGRADGELRLSVTDTIGALSYDWRFIPNALGNLADSLASGDYSVTVSDAFCSVTLPFHIYQLSLPVACFRLSPSGNSYSFGSLIQFWDCSDNADLWHWDFGNGEVSNEQNTSYSYPQVGVYTVSLAVNDAFGCADTTTQIVEVREEMRIYIPNSFSPNGDGLNDVFMPAGIQLSEDGYRLEIFNRWGQMVFSTTDLNQGWDGMFRGKMVEKGTILTYLLHYQNKDGRQFVREGHVTVL